MTQISFIIRWNLLIYIFAGSVLATGTKELPDYKAFRDAVSLENIRSHQLELQNIANQNSNNRMALTNGYKASVSYVEKVLKESGYDVVRQDFTVSTSEDRNPPNLVKKAPIEQVFVAGQDFSCLSSAGLVTLMAQVEAVDLVVPSLHKNHSNSGCEMADYTQFTPGNIALIQRGTCSFQTKVENAIKAGAVGVILFNEGNPEREGVIESRISGAPDNYPIIGASFAVGEALRNNILSGPTGNNVLLSIDVEKRAKPVQNLIAETKVGDASKTLVVGAHLDSVAEGPGMNDNGSGSASILEIAKQLALLNVPLQNKVRFIWFGAEEFGLLGSEYYVSALSAAEQNNIMAMLNFDMLGSANYARFVYNGSNASAISGYIEQVFLDYFSSVNLITHPTAFDGRSDYGPFIEVGIPAGGLFSGAEGRKSRELARIYGGTAGKSFDPCYHRACDNFDTTSDQNGSLALQSLDELSDAAAHATLFLASNTIPTNLIGKREKGNIQFEYKGHLMVR